MATITERKFRISSVIENLSEYGMAEGEAEKTEIVPDGFLKSDGEEIEITYSEQTEGGRVDSEILIYPEAVSVVRRGAVVSNMRFEEGLLHKSLYEVVPYSFDTEVFTKKIRNSMTAEGGRLDIFYTMKIGGQNKKVRMKIECL